MTSDMMISDIFVGFFWFVSVADPKRKKYRVQDLYFYSVNEVFLDIFKRYLLSYKL